MNFSLYFYYSCSKTNSTYNLKSFLFRFKNCILKIIIMTTEVTAATVTAAAATATSQKASKDTVFTLKRWNLVAVWSWDVECDVCAICRTFLIG